VEEYSTFEFQIKAAFNFAENFDNSYEIHEMEDVFDGLFILYTKEMIQESFFIIRRNF
jgi:hypothetical protein